MNRDNGLSLFDNGLTILPSSFVRINPNHVCALCPTKDGYSEEEEIVLNLYLKWEAAKDIVAFYLSGTDIKEEEIISHAKAYGWEFYRRRDTKQMYQAMLGKALPHLLEKADKMPAKDFVRIAKQLDVISGNEIAKQNNSATFDERGMNTIFAALNEELRKTSSAAEMDAILNIYEMQLPGIKDIWKRHRGLIGAPINDQDVIDYVEGKPLE